MSTIISINELIASFDTLGTPVSSPRAYKRQALKPQINHSQTNPVKSQESEPSIGEETNLTGFNNFWCMLTLDSLNNKGEGLARQLHNDKQGFDFCHKFMNIISEAVEKMTENKYNDTTETMKLVEIADYLDRYNTTKDERWLSSADRTLDSYRWR